MKKLLLFLSIIVLLSGCQSKEAAIQEKTNENTNMNTNVNANVSSQSGKLQEAYARLGLEDLLGQYNGAILKTSMGDIKVKFYNTESPLTVNNFLNLAKKGFYDGTSFHRVIADFMIQGGDPNSKDADRTNDGMGGPAYKFADEFNDHKLVKGSLAMANSGPNTNGSQFFIVTAAATSWLDGKHTNFGEVIEGLDIVDKIGVVKTDKNDHPLKDVTINSIELIKIE